MRDKIIENLQAANAQLTQDNQRLLLETLNKLSQESKKRLHEETLQLEQRNSELEMLLQQERDKKRHKTNNTGSDDENEKEEETNPTPLSIGTTYYRRMWNESATTTSSSSSSRTRKYQGSLCPPEAPSLFLKAKFR